MRNPVKLVFLPMETDLDKDNKKVYDSEFVFLYINQFHKRNNNSCDIYLNENVKLDMIY